EDAYRRLYNPALYLRAYGRLYRNKGAMTRGATEETVDGMSESVPKGSGGRLGRPLVAELLLPPRRAGTADHPMDRAQLHHRRGGLRQPLEVPHQPSPPQQASEG